MNMHESSGGSQLGGDASSHARRMLNKRPVELLGGSIDCPSSSSTFYETVNLKIQKLRLTGEPESRAARSAPIVTRRRVVLCEERNVSYPGRLVSSRGELRSSWLDRDDFKRIQGDNLRALATIKREMSAGGCKSSDSLHTDYSLAACPRGLELYLSKLQTPKKKCSPQRQLTRGVVQLYRQSPHPPDQEQLRIAYRLLTQKDRLRAVQVAYLDALEAQLLANTILHSDLHVQPAAVAETPPLRLSRSGGSCRTDDVLGAPLHWPQLVVPPAHHVSVVRFL
jgi:hypothetical protein